MKNSVILSLMGTMVGTVLMLFSTNLVLGQGGDQTIAPSSEFKRDLERLHIPLEHIPHDTQQRRRSLGIPLDTVRRAFLNRHGLPCYRYVKKPPFRDTVAEEVVRKGIPIELRLLRLTDEISLKTNSGRIYYKRLRHGAQRRWYEDGTPKVLENYKDGIREGDAKHWSEDGKLVGWYQMKGGTGVERVYWPSGRLKHYVEYVDNRKNGLEAAFHENGKVKYMYRNKNGKLVGASYDFAEDGSIQSVSHANEKGELVGPIAEFYENGDLRAPIHYWLNGRKVSKEEYLKARERNSALLAVEDDAKKYAKVDAKNRAHIAMFLSLQPVKIPLEQPTSNKTQLELAQLTKKGKPKKQGGLDPNRSASVQQTDSRSLAYLIAAGVIAAAILAWVAYKRKRVQ